MKNPFKRQEKALTISGGVIDAFKQGGSVYPLLGGGSSQRVVEAFNVAQNASYSWMYRNSPAVRTVIDTIVRNVGQLDLRLYEELSESERQPRPDHPAAMSMRYPSETSTADGLIRSLFTDYLIHDNAYALLTPGANGQVMIERLPSFMVVVKGPSLFQVDEYWVWPQGAWNTGQWAGSGTPVIFPPERIMHWHGENPLDPRVGLSRLDTLRDVIAEDAALSQAIIELANNGLQAPIWVSRPLEAPEMTAETLRAHEEDVANRIRSRNRRPPVMIEGEKLESFGISPQDAEMLAVRRFAIERVAMAFGVPPASAGVEPATPDTVAQFYNDTLPPYCQNFAKMLNQRLLVRVFNEPDYCFEFDLDEKTGWQNLPNLISAAGAPVMTRDEARAKINLPPKPGGDELITPGNVTVGGKPSVGVMPVQDPNRPPQDGSYRTDQGPTPAGDYGQVPKSVEVEAKKQSAYPIPSYVHRREQDKQVQDRNITRFERSLQNYFATFSGELQTKSVQRKADSRSMNTDWQRWTSQLGDRLFRVIREVMAGEGRRYAKRFGGSFDLGKTKNYRQAMAQGSAQQIMDSVRQGIDENGVDWGLGRLPQHAASAAALLGARATIWARQEAARQSPDVGRRQETWVKDTERHASLDGKSVALGGVWPGGLRPGSSPGCRCTSTIS